MRQFFDELQAERRAEEKSLMEPIVGQNYTHDASKRPVKVIELSEPVGEGKSQQVIYVNAADGKDRGWVPKSDFFKLFSSSGGRW